MIPFVPPSDLRDFVVCSSRALRHSWQGTMTLDLWPMHLRFLCVLCLSIALPAGMQAQGSPYVPLDDPRLPLAEHLITRGVLRDPSPQIRPFRRDQIVAALAVADTAPDTPDGRLVRALRETWTDLDAESRWLVEGRLGAQAYTRQRRDLLHPGGSSSVQPYLDLRLEGVFGPIVAVSRPAIEPRLSKDPDWRGRTDLKVVGRMSEAYLAAQFRFGSIWFGQFDQQWGPVGTYGIPIGGGVSYPRPYLGLEVGSRDVRLAAQVATLRDEVDTAGAIIKRYHVMHRLSIRTSERLSLALWETTILAGEDRSLEGRFINPLSLLLLANQYGEGDPGNVTVGFDASWRAFRRATLELQLALDDLQYQSTGYPNRWAFTASAFGPLGNQLAWRGTYTAASTLAFQSTDGFENYAERGVGIGRGFPDMDLVSFSVSLPVANRWLISPTLAAQRQGERRLTEAAPATAAEADDLPEIHSGTLEKTLRLSLGASGRARFFDLSADAGVSFVNDADNVEGRNRTRFEGKLQATLYFSRRGVLQ